MMLKDQNEGICALQEDKLNQNDIIDADSEREWSWRWE